MTYDQAMAAVRRGATATRPGVGFEVARRFGHPVLLGKGDRHIAYTPTREDMTADDWLLVTTGGTEPS